MIMKSQETVKKVQLFIPCFMDQLYPQVGISTVQILEQLGIEVLFNTNQTCCGQPAFNAGFWDDARSVCRKFINDFSGTEYIVTPSASCSGFVKNYYQKLFENSTDVSAANAVSRRVVELSSFLVNHLGVTDLGASLLGTATYHDSCAALRECGIKQEPRLLLEAVKGLELVEMNDVETCCGFGGTFAVKFEGISQAMADQKITHAQATEAQCVISTDVSCLMHLQGIAQKQGRQMKWFHLAEVLAGNAVI